MVRFLQKVFTESSKLLLGNLSSPKKNDSANVVDKLTSKFEKLNKTIRSSNKMTPIYAALRIYENECITTKNINWKTEP